MRPGRERRRNLLRRDINDLVRSPDGKVSEAKLWSNVGKCVAVWLLIEYAGSGLKMGEWVLAILLAALIAPDLAKKVMTMRMGGAPAAPEAKK